MGERLALLERFACLGSACPQTCCGGWTMQVDPVRRALYSKGAPDLAADVEETEAGPSMRRDPETGLCVRLTDGWCGVHRAAGTAMLGDACHFYPRVTRALGGTVVMSATPSCPEVARIALFADDAFGLVPATFDRLPVDAREAAPDGLSAADARRVMAAFDRLATDPPSPPERALSRITTVARSLRWIPADTWAGSLDFLTSSSDARLSPPEPDADDDIHLFHILAGLIRAARHRPSERLLATVEDIQRALGVLINWDTLDLWGDPRVADMREDFARFRAASGATLDPLLRRWLRLQLSLTAFPFAGPGANPEERATLLAVRFAVTRLALEAHVRVNATFEEAGAVRVVQSLARLLDHLADPALMLNLCRDAGFTREPRLRGLLEPHPQPVAPAFEPA
jgi:lysine-N-methylase